MAPTAKSQGSRKDQRLPERQTGLISVLYGVLAAFPHPPQRVNAGGSAPGFWWTTDEGAQATANIKKMVIDRGRMRDGGGTVKRQLCFPMVFRDAVLAV